MASEVASHVSREGRADVERELSSLRIIHRNTTPAPSFDTAPSTHRQTSAKPSQTHSDLLSSEFSTVKMSTDLWYVLSARSLHQGHGCLMAATALESYSEAS